jgi:hypothetical protein
VGNFYVNHTVKAPQARVVEVLRKERRTAYVAPTVKDWTVLCDKASDGQDPGAITDLAKKLASALKCPVVAVLNHDDDILCYWAFDESGEQVEYFNSCPDYFEGMMDDIDPEELGMDPEDLEPDDTPIGDGKGLCQVVGKPSAAAKVKKILVEGGGMAVMQHQELVAALGLPDCSPGAGYRYVKEGDGFSEFPREQVEHVKPERREQR